MNEVEYHKKQVSDHAPAEIQEQIPIGLSKNKKRNDLSIHVLCKLYEKLASVVKHSETSSHKAHWYYNFYISRDIN